MPEELNADEKALMSAMQADDEPVTEEEQEAAQPAPEPEPSPEPAPEPAPAPEEPVADPSKPPEGHVPHSAMHKEREQRKAAEARLRELEAQLAQLQQPKEPGIPPMPDAITDPQGHQKWHMDRYAEQQQRWQQQEDQVRRQQNEQAMMQQAARIENEFAAAHPDYGDAVGYAHNQRVEELRTYGYMDEEIQAIIVNDARTIYERAVQSGRNPAQALYDIAKMRGYKGAQAAAPAPGAAPVATPEQIAAKGMAAQQTATLATAGGPAASGGMTFEQYANLPEGEMAAWKAANPAEYKRLVGG